MAFQQSNVWAFDLWGNQSHKKWRTSQSTHFHLHHEQSLSPLADEVLLHAERARDTLAARYGVSWRQPVDLVLQDALFSNGEANTHANRVRIWASDWGLPLRSAHPWLADVIHHEFGHVASIAAGAKVPTWLYGIHFGYESYNNSSKRIQAGVLLPSVHFPAWFAEGTAQYESARLGYDRWDAHRELLVRTMVENKTLLSLEEMQSFLGPKHLDFELGPYTLGFAKVRYIAERYGDASIPRLWKALSKPTVWTFSQACQSVLGVNERQLDRNWRKYLDSVYAKPVETWQSQKLSQGSWAQSHLIATPCGIWWLSNRGSESWNQSPAFISKDSLAKIKTFQPFPNDSIDSNVPAPRAQLSKDSSTQVKKTPDTLLQLQDLKPIQDFPTHKIAWDKGWDLWPQGANSQKVSWVAVSYAQRNQNGETHFDLVRLDSGAKEAQKITRLRNAIEPSIRKDGRAIAYARKIPGSPCFSLEMIAIDSTGQSSFEPITLWGDPKEAPCVDRQAREPKWSADGQTIAFVLSAGGKRRLALWSAQDSQVRVVWDQGYDVRHPTWGLGKDSLSLYFSSDAKGRFEIYRWNTSQQSAEQLTSSGGGAFYPAPDSSALNYVRFDKDGFSLYTQNLRTTRDTAIDSNHLSATQAQLWNQNLGQIVDGRPTRPYPILPTRWIVLPAVLGQERSQGIRAGTQGETFWQTGLILQTFDPIERNSFMFQYLFEPDFGKVDPGKGGLGPALQQEFGASWTYKGLPFTTGLDFMWRQLPGQDSVRSEAPDVPDGLNRYSMRIQALQNRWSHSFFHAHDLWNLQFGYMGADFDFYEQNFAWTFYKALHTSLGFQYGHHEDESSPGELPEPGWNTSLFWTFQQGDLFRPGSFKESFKVSASGAIEPVYRTTQLQMVQGDFAFQIPFFHPESRFVWTLNGLSLPWWSSKDEDTLNTFYLPGAKLHGYPNMNPRGEDQLLSGRSQILSTAHLIWPLWTGAQSLGPLMFRGVWIDLFAEQLWLWKEPPAWTQIDQGNSYRSTGVELRLAQKLWYSLPWQWWARAAWALDDVDHPEGLYRPQGIWGAHSPSKIEFGLSFSFDKPGEIKMAQPKHLGPQWLSLPDLKGHTHE